MHFGNFLLMRYAYTNGRDSSHKRTSKDSRREQDQLFIDENIKFPNKYSPHTFSMTLY